MKCPLMLMDWRSKPEEKSFLPKDCLKEECAWWVEPQGRCAIEDIALSLGFISTDITRMLEKMPHEEQFRR